MPARVSPTPLDADDQVRRFGVKVRVVVDYLRNGLVDRGKLGSEMLDCPLGQRPCHVIRHAAGAAILPFCQASDRAVPDRLEFAQPPHCRRRWRPGAGFKKFSVFSNVGGVDLIGLVAPQLATRKVADLLWIDDAHDVSCLMECKRDAQAVAPRCLQTSVDLSYSCSASQAIKLRHPAGELAKLLERGFAPTSKLVSSVFLQTSMPSTVSIILGFFFDFFQRWPRIDRPCTQDLRQNAS